MCYYWGDKKDLVNHNNNYYAFVQYVCSVIICLISQSIIFCDIYVIIIMYAVCIIFIYLSILCLCMYTQIIMHV